MIPAPYTALRQAQSVIVRIRGLDYHVLTWGNPTNGTPVMFACHGWMDVAASFQFMVDAFSQDRCIVAPDWRGFGRTMATSADHFVFADYLLDLDCLLDHFSPEAPVDLIGHSMGGNIALCHAGLRPARIRKLVNIEGFGLPATQPQEAPQRLAAWMDNVKALHAGSLQLRSYADLAAVARRLQQTNPRLPDDKALWLASQWAAQDTNGQWHIRAHAGHKIPNHQLYHVDEMLACLQQITAPVLCVESEEDSISQFWGERYSHVEYRQRMTQIRQVRHARIAGSGHMLQHDQPGVLARLIEEFLAE